MLILSLPLIFVGIANIIRGDNKFSFDAYLSGDQAHPGASTAYKDSVYVLGRIIPLISQLSALIFGYIRSKTKESKIHQIVEKKVDDNTSHDSVSINSDDFD